MSTYAARVVWHGGKDDIRAHTVEVAEQSLAGSSASYEDDAEGTMNGTRFTRVVLRPRVEFETDIAPELLEELHRRSHEACFIANSVSCPVEVEPR